MGRAENRFWDFVIRHRWKIFLACVTILSMYARFAFRGFISPDMNIFLIPWYDAIQDMGGLNALKIQVGNYQISYQVMISLMTCLPIHKVYAYKGLSILFDYALGITAGQAVREITGSRAKAAIAYAAVVLLPITVLNSAAWGQCDSIYTFFLLLCFLMLLRNRQSLAMLSFGMAFAFKLQAVFFLPFLLFYHVWSKKIPAWKLLLVFVPILFFSVFGLVQGRSLADILKIYVDQGGQYEQISLYYPSFWNLMVINAAENGVDHYEELHAFCIAITVVSLGVIMVLLIQRKELDGEKLLMIATLMMYSCVLFLPAMHERYAYPVLIFAVLAGCVYPGMIPMALGMLIIDLQTYGLYLMEKEVLSWDFLVLLNISCYSGTAWLTWRRVKLNKIFREV